MKVDQRMLSQAIAFAARAHEGQLRRDGRTPYIVHSMEVLSIAATLTEDLNVLSAAVLHDVIEDCAVTELELHRLFGERVARLVMHQTEAKESDAKASWQRRKLRMLQRLCTFDRDDMVLMLSDKLSNLRAIHRDCMQYGDRAWLRMNQVNPTLQHWYYASVADGLKPLSDTLPYQEYLTYLPVLSADRHLPR